MGHPTSPERHCRQSTVPPYESTHKIASEIEHQRQRQADRPLLVVAGAGSGKTLTMIRRIEKIVQSTGEFCAWARGHHDAVAPRKPPQRCIASNLILRDGRRAALIRRMQAIGGAGHHVHAQRS